MQVLIYAESHSEHWTQDYDQEESYRLHED